MQVEFPGLFDLQINGFAGVDFTDSLSHAGACRVPLRGTFDRRDSLSADAHHIFL